LAKVSTTNHKLAFTGKEEMAGNTMAGAETESNIQTYNTMKS
jgi:hypothetical protein